MLRKITAIILFITAITFIVLGAVGIFNGHQIFEGVLLILAGLILAIIAIGLWSNRKIKELIEDWTLSWPL